MERNFSITPEDPQSDNTLFLIQAMFKDVPYRYHPDADPADLAANAERVFAAMAEFDRPGCIFLVARTNGAVAGCGAIQQLDTHTGEVRRMFVLPEYRRKGIARHILADLEDFARAQGYTTLLLETGILQPEAIALYEQAGYARTEPYGPFANDPVSLFYKKSLK